MEVELDPDPLLSWKKRLLGKSSRDSEGRFDFCLSKVNNSGDVSDGKLNAEGEQTVSTVPAREGLKNENSTYGSWMLVERRNEMEKLQGENRGGDLVKSPNQTGGSSSMNSDGVNRASTPFVKVSGQATSSGHRNSIGHKMNNGAKEPKGKEKVGQVNRPDSGKIPIRLGGLEILARSGQAKEDQLLNTLEDNIVVHCDVTKPGENIVDKSGNQEGCASIKFFHIYKEYYLEFKPDIVSLLKPRKKWRILWEKLMATIPSASVLWLAIGDFNVIFSFEEKKGGSSSGISGKWNPIRLSRSGPDLSHLFFADDFVIFSKADLKHAIVLKEILNDFFVLSGHQVHNLGTYLGMPLFHDRAICSTVRFVVEKVRRKLNNWDAKQLQWQCKEIAQLFGEPLLRYNLFCEKIYVVMGLGIWTCLGLEDIIKRIVSIPPSYPLEGKDRNHWIDTFTGSFSVKSVYRSLRESSWHFKDGWWKVRRGIGQIGLCLVCGHGDEDLIHVLRDCPGAREVLIKVEVLHHCNALWWLPILVTNSEIQWEKGSELDLIGLGFNRVMVESDLESGNSESLHSMRPSNSEGNRFLEFNKSTDTRNLELQVGMIFVNWEILKEAIKQYEVEPLTNALSREVSPTYSICSLQWDVTGDFLIHVTHTKCARAKNRELEMVLGNHNRQYGFVYDYLGELRANNPRTTTICMLNERLSQRMYICLGPCKEGFNARCRPNISLDGCFLKGYYGGLLKLACMQHMK
ncbi:hypothetical protein PVK06_043140 [Gossypium arboreum]|uniref:Reverse transcriptase zinc-binding domain-containing protein n=1 Tax=Gossypium arboreum TaxID=29729 RepID=A0ABR0MN38_GOSAR|nr:hypothetical protein PVK06_043140 [Gossypium arboreum]